MFFAQKMETLVADKAAPQLRLCRVKKTAGVSKISAENIFTIWGDMIKFWKCTRKCTMKNEAKKAALTIFRLSV